MTKSQIATVGAAVLLLLVMYIGCDTKPQKIKDVEKSRSLVTEATDINVLLTEAKDSLKPSQLALISALEDELAAQPTDTGKVSKLKQLSGQWFQLDRPAIAGHYAEEVAELLNTEESWSITGTTYAIAVQSGRNQRVRDYATGRAVKAFENAISINPKEIGYKLNLALLYTDNPPADNPMKGILMILDLNRANPDNPNILMNLGRLAIRTNQFDKAVERLERALTLDPSLTPAICMLGQAYAGLGQMDKAKSYEQRCAAAQQ
jgi:tetratricopeptide (TPR) repeat protein